jgi:hypothetical protein
MILVFDVWFEHLPQKSPAPFTTNVPESVYKNMKRKSEIIVMYLLRNQLSYPGMLAVLSYLYYFVYFTLIFTGCSVLWQES